jgi:lipid-binding SYLF domain-containing protein
MDRWAMTAMVAATLSLAAPTSSWAQSREQKTVIRASAALQEIVSGQLDAIPRSMLADAYGVAIVPDVIKGSFIVGARYGNGVLLIRDGTGQWHAPVFVRLTGGNVGWQVGVQATDVVLVFKTQKSIDGILAGKFTIGADAAAAAGPVGRQASAATDARLRAEVYSYSRSRGLFVGVALDGSVIEVDRQANANYYKTSSLNGAEPPPVPAEAVDLVQRVATLAAGDVPGGNAASTPTSVLAQRHAESEEAALRQQLSSAAPQLYGLLDPQWQSYLALPLEIFHGEAVPSPEALRLSLERFDAVAANPQFQPLAQRPEFQTLHGLLRQYVNLRNSGDQPLALPPPPPSG